ncbi:MAG: class I SAM-dependent methyltransferase [Desulfomonilaceae bacterium]|nr:class I SAM-dependent methyltransferase [Desulfomonilaceae bacterium]
MMVSNSEAFRKDARRKGGYQYTTDPSLSSVLANRRLSQATLEIADFTNKRVLDIGCGDGTYTSELYDHGGPSELVGIDPVAEAVEVARQRGGRRHLTWVVGSTYGLPFTRNRFDIAYLRGVLHHLDHPKEALREAFRVARCLVVIEPNGYNPGLKLLERFSPYHVEHGEKSYCPGKVDSWIRSLGGSVKKRRFVGLVPMFCPDWVAGSLKRIEPALEAMPLARMIGCAVYVFRAER